MNAAIGDRIIVKSHRLGEPDRDARILQVQGNDGGPPFLVEWDEDGHVGLYFPGSDSVIEHFPAHNG